MVCSESVNGGRKVRRVALEKCCTFRAKGTDFRGAGQVLDVGGEVERTGGRAASLQFAPAGGQRFVGAAEPRFAADKAAALFPRFTRKPIPDAGHFLHIYALNKLVPILGSFLQSLAIR